MKHILKTAHASKRAITNRDVMRVICSFPVALSGFLLSGFFLYYVVILLGDFRLIELSLFRYSIIFIIITSACFVTGGTYVIPTGLRRLGFWILFIFISCFWVVTFRKYNNWAVMALTLICGWISSFILLLWGWTLRMKKGTG